MNYDKEIPMTDTEYMKLAIEEAKKAEAEGEIPIGALVVYKDLIMLPPTMKKNIQTTPPPTQKLLPLERQPASLAHGV